MSTETAKWLNTMILIGDTDVRGNAWHYRASEQGAESNHYAGAIPVADVLRRLFHWQHAIGEVAATYTIVGDDGLPTDVTIPGTGRQAIIRPVGTFGPDDQGAILGLFKSGFKVHPYGEWLVDGIAKILDDDLHIATAGLLKGGAQAWVQVEIANNVSASASNGLPDVEFRPFLMAATSVDGSLSTTFNRGITVGVCDNTVAAALADKTQQVKYRHSTYSQGRIGEARNALGIVYETADVFAEAVKAMTATVVTDTAWRAFLDAHAPLGDTSKPSRSLTMAETHRGELQRLWTSDQRVAPWAGTAFGVVQAVNTYGHHVQNVKGAGRAERNMSRMVKGEWATLDAQTMDTLNKVLAKV